MAEMQVGVVECGWGGFSRLALFCRKRFAWAEAGFLSFPTFRVQGMRREVPFISQSYNDLHRIPPRLKRFE
jgi:hypothetical protein